MVVRVKQQPVVRVPVVRVPYHHAHGCNVCGRRFADTCARPVEARTCVTCRTGQAASREDFDREPKPCCLVHSRLVTDVDVMSKYGLAGHTPWFQCITPGCSRTHPFDPTTQGTGQLT